MFNQKIYLILILFYNVLLAQQVLNPYYTIQIREENGEIKEIQSLFKIPEKEMNKQLDKFLINIRGLMELVPAESEFKKSSENIRDLIFIMLTYPNNTGLNFIDSYDKSIINDMQKITQQGFLQKAKCDTSTMLCNYYRVLYVITILRNFKQTCNTKIIDNQDFKKLLYTSIYYATYDTIYDKSDIIAFTIC